MERKLDAGEERRQVYGALNLVLANRVRGRLPVTKKELLGKQELDRPLVNRALTALKRSGWVERVGYKGWIPIPLPQSGICWTHLKELTNGVCPVVGCKEKR